MQELQQPATVEFPVVASRSLPLFSSLKKTIPNAPRFSLLPTFLREMICARTLPREPEPDLIMDGDDQVEAYAAAGRIDGVMSAAYLFHAARMSLILQGCRTVVDLGCGPATQLSQVAELNPDSQFIGVDLSETMLENARRHIGDQGLTNVTFARDDVSRLDTISDNSADAVVSTMALHHLPSSAHLEGCFRQINRILRPDGAVYIADFGRLKSLKSVIFFAYMNRKYQPHLFSLDYERSLRAAFLFEELKSIAAEELPATVTVHGTFIVPLLTVIKTPDRPLREDQRQHFREMRRNLPRRYRADLDDIRRFFRLGGLKDDPFS